MKFCLALALACATTLLSVPAEAQQVIKAANGQCVGISEVDGVTLVLADCFNRGTTLGLTVDSYTYQGPIRITTSDGRAGCLDAYRGANGAVEAVACDGTPEQNWDLSALFTNAGMSTCISVGRGGGVLNVSCDGSRRQQFFLETLTTADLVASPAGSFGSGVAPNPQPGLTGGGGLVGQDGASLIGNDAGSLVGQDGASVVGHNGGALIGADGSTLIGNDAGSLVGQDGASVIVNNGGNLNGTSMDGYGGIVAAGAGNAVYNVQSVETTTGPLLTMLAPRRCLDVTGGLRDPGYQLILWDCHGGESQQFTIDPAGQIRVFGLCVDAFGGAGNNGDAVGTYPCNGTPNQQWTQTPSGEIRGINDRCLAVSYADGSPGALIILWDCVGGHESQIWTRS